MVRNELLHTALRRALRRGALLVLAFAMAVGCGGGGSGGDPAGSPTPSPPPRTAPDPGVVDTFAYRAGSPHAADLRPCTYAANATQRCTLSRLPFLGMEVADPGIDDVLARTLVSHTWMGDNLAAVLAQLPADVLPLFRSITAVVIASDVRPARYLPDTGAIYLDPDFLWLSVAERDTVSTAPDPRSGFGLDLQFQMPWRYVRDNQRLAVIINADGSRDLAQIVEIMGYLLYHELAHALDFVPPERLPGLDPGLTVAQARNLQPPLSSAFVAGRPLGSTLLKSLAGVSFLGDDATADELALTPAALVDEFVNDGAVQYYAYTTQYEDFATLFETAMMKWHFGYDKDTGITDRPAGGGTNAAVVTWGTRGRLGEQPVHGRVLDVAQRIYPGDLAAFEAFLAAEPAAPLRMRPGETWSDNLVLEPVAEGDAAGAAVGGGIDRSGRTVDYFLERVPIR